MSMRNTKDLFFAVLVSGCVLALPNGFAQEAYPSKPIRVIVPTATGGPTDVVIRGLSHWFAERNGQPFIIENRIGANTILAAEACAKAAADGYAMCVFPRATIALNPVLYQKRKLPYDAEKSFEPITNLVVGQQVLVLHPSIPASNFNEMVAWSKANPSRINYASAGIGSNVHLVMERMRRQTGASLTHVPYKAASEAPQAFQRGDVHLMYLIIGNPGVMDQIRTGKSKPLLQSGFTRNAQLPDIPTFAEAGVADFDPRNWFGMFAPAGTPKPVIAKLSTELNAILRLPAFKDKILVPMGFDALGGTPEEFASFLVEDRRRGAELVRDSGARLD
jgi:tripartite-type tricarboxylate transporter receptor subunit TctC